MPSDGHDAPLVVIDADVLGRQRTGDETYVANLLRELPAVAPDLRLAAVTRRPGARAGRRRAGRARRARAGAADGRGRCRACCAGCGPTLAHFQHALPLRLPVPGGRDGPRPLVRARPRADGPARPARLPHARAARGAAAPRACSPSPSARATTSSSSTAVAPTRIVVTPNGVDPAFRPAPRRAATATLLFVGAIQARKDPLAAVEAAARGRPAARRRRAARRTRRSRASSTAAAPTCAATSSASELAALYRGAACARAPVALRGLRPARARGDGLRDAGRRDARPGAARGRRRRGRRSPSRERLADGDRAGARRPRAARRRRARARAPLQLGRDGAAHGRRLPRGARR